MNPHDESFVPETVDEQIDLFLQRPPQQEQNISSEMVQTLQSLYTEDPRLQRLWNRLQRTELRTIRHAAEETDTGHKGLDEQLLPPSPNILPQEMVNVMQIYTNQKQNKNSSRRLWSLLAAVILVVMLLGSMLAVLQFSRQSTAGQPDGKTPGQNVPTGGSTVAPTHVPTVLPTPTSMPTTTACPASGKARAAIMPALSAGSTSAIVYLNPTAAILKLYSIKTHQTTTILNQNGTISTAQISNDGRWILYVLVTQNTSAIQLIRMDGKYQQTLYCAPANTSIGDKANVQWSPNQKLLIFPQTNLGTHITTLELLNLNTGQIQVEMTPTGPLATSNYYAPRTWMDTTHVYVTNAPNMDGMPAALQLLDISKGAQQTPDDLQIIQGVTDTPWDFDSTYDGSKLFIVHADPVAGRGGPGTYCNISAYTTSGQNGTTIFSSTTLTPNQLRVAGYGSSTLLLSVNRPADPADRYNGLWKLNANGTGLVELTAQPDQLNEFSQYPWANVSRDGINYAYGASYGSLNGGNLTSYTTDPALLVGWTTV